MGHFRRNWVLSTPVSPGLGGHHDWLQVPARAGDPRNSWFTLKPQPGSRSGVETNLPPLVLSLLFFHNTQEMIRNIVVNSSDPTPPTL